MTNERFTPGTSGAGPTPLAELQARAMALFRLVLLCTLFGYRMVRPDGVPVAGEPVVIPREYPAGIHAIVPAGTGTAGRTPRAFLRD